MNCCGIEEGGHAGTCCHLLLLGVPNRELLPLHVPLALFLAHCSYAGGNILLLEVYINYGGHFRYMNRSCWNTVMFPKKKKKNK